jgi:hypothetical protein
MMVEASDGPRRPPPPTEWVAATTYESASLELLEGRHPLALAQFANHATRALPANTMVAPVRFRLRVARPPPTDKAAADGAAAAAATSGGGGGGGAAGVAVEEPGPDEPGWLRAYVPFIPYAMEPGLAHLVQEVSWL